MNIHDPVHLYNSTLIFNHIGVFSFGSTWIIKQFCNLTFFVPNVSWNAEITLYFILFFLRDNLYTCILHMISLTVKYIVYVIRAVFYSQLLEV